MGSKGRIPINTGRPLPGPGMFQDHFGHGSRSQHGHLPHELMHPPEIIEQKLAAQHMEMQTLATENQRLAATHSALRHELAAAQHELQRIQSRISGGKFEYEQQMAAMFDKSAKMEADLRSLEPLKLELNQAQSECQSLAASRQDLISKVQEMSQDLQKSHGDAQQIPPLMSELDAVRHEYQHCRASYDYERKLRIDHYESLQVMEKNYVSMLAEVEKLQRELVNAAHADKIGGSYGSNMGYKENDATGQHSVSQNAYEEGYRANQALGPAGNAAQFGGAPARSGYDAAARNTNYEAPRTIGYDTPAALQRGPNYEPAKGLSYDPTRGPAAYETRNSISGGPQGAPATANPVPHHMMPQMQAPPYESTQVPAPYGAHLHAAYGVPQASSRPLGGYEAGPVARGAPAGGGANQMHNR